MNSLVKSRSGGGSKPSKSSDSSSGSKKGSSGGRKASEDAVITLTEDNFGMYVCSYDAVSCLNASFQLWRRNALR